MVVGSQMNKFVQVSCGYQQMSLAGSRSPGMMWGRGTSPGLMSKRKGVPYHVTYSMMHFDVTSHHPYTHGQTDTCENITFSKFRLRAVKNCVTLFWVSDI